MALCIFGVPTKNFAAEIAPMGNVLSRRPSIRDQMQRYEDEIETRQRQLVELQKAGSAMAFCIFALVVALGAALAAYIEDSYPVMVFLVAVLVFGATRVAARYLRGMRLRATEDALKSLRARQHALIKEYKKDNNFVFAKKIVDRYEDEESRESFFRQIQKKKRDAVDKLTDYVLATDPAKMNALICRSCGLHNGLLDPANRDIQFFYCYSCKARNDRVAGSP